MKPVSEWARVDLATMIAEDVRESLTLDYKRSAALGRENKQRSELSKDVSAFANSAGGVIIYGIEEKGQKPFAIDDGCDDTVVTREFIEQIINSKIQPRVQGIVIQQIPLAPGRSAYAISIPQATSLAPHQAHDNRYYRRFNFESVPMADYEVRDTLRRATTPQLFLELYWTPPRVAPGGLTSTAICAIGNHAPEPAFYSVVSLMFDHGLAPVDPEEFRVVDSTVMVNGSNMGVREMHRNLKIPEHQPIFKETKFGIAHVPTLLSPNRAYIVGHRLICPGFTKEVWGWIRATPQGVHYEELPNGLPTL